MPQFMKALVFAFLVSIAPANMLVAQTSSETPKFTLILSADNPEVTLGSNIEIWIKITNISEDTLTLVFGDWNGVATDYQYEVRDEQGAMVAKIVPRHLVGSNRRGILKPGSSIGSGTLISAVYQFDRPGKYTIQVSRKEPGMPLVQSNIITVTVLPAPPPPAQ
jgi:hypothetical protein